MWRRPHSVLLCQMLADNAMRTLLFAFKVPSPPNQLCHCCFEVRVRAQHGQRSVSAICYLVVHITSALINANCVKIPLPKSCILGGWCNFYLNEIIQLFFSPKLDRMHTEHHREMQKHLSSQSGAAPVRKV